MEKGKLVIFIDGNNLFHAAKIFGVEIDYSKLLNYLCAGGTLLRAFFYTGVDENAEKQKGFLLWMRRNGYRVVEKELKTFPDGTKKANLDVEIAVDMLSLADSYDTAMLVSGDEDFAYAVNAVAFKGCRVEVAGFRHNTAPKLIDVADRYIELDSTLDKIAKNYDPEKVEKNKLFISELQAESKFAWGSGEEQPDFANDIGFIPKPSGSTLISSKKDTVKTTSKTEEIMAEVTKLSKESKAKEPELEPKPKLRKITRKAAKTTETSK